jgi:hypothetical protein
MKFLVGEGENGVWHRQKDPFEIVITGVLSTLAAVQLVVGAPPDSLSILLPTWAQAVWFVMIIASGSAVLVGMTWRDLIGGLFIEQVGLSGMAISLITYALAIIVTTWFSLGAMLSVTTVMVLGIAYWWKRVQLRRILKELPT